MISRIELSPYRLPLRRTWSSARGDINERVGWLVRMHGDGLCGFGDCAPFPGAGTENHATASLALTEWRAQLIGMSLCAALERLEADGDRVAVSACFAMESALLDIAAKRANLPLCRWLSASAADSVEVNATLGPLRAVTPSMLRQQLASGHRVMKLKVGLESWDLELSRLRELARGLPANAFFRLDANGAWTAEQAAQIVETLNGLPVESLEEPLRIPEPESLRQLQATANFALALDETLHTRGSDLDLERLPVRRIVLKPAVVGGLRKTLELAREASRLGIQVAITSLIETAAGVWPTLQLAAALPGQAAHGLATSSWLSADLGRPPTTARGHILLPEGAGSGFSPFQ